MHAFAAPPIALVTLQSGHYALVFGRRRRLPVCDVGESWAVSQGEYDGWPLLVRVNTGYRAAVDRADYPIQIGVAVPIRSADDRGWPSGDENRLLQRIEDSLIALVDGRAVLVGVLTVNGVREFVLYSGADDWVEQFHHELASAVDTHAVQVMAKRDSDWSTYNELVGDT